MKLRLFFLTLGLFAVQLTVACASATPTQVVLPTVESVPVEATATETVANTNTPEATALPAATEIPVQAVATSRGPELEATDPTTVSLASGQLHLVEFFRFT